MMKLLFYNIKFSTHVLLLMPMHALEEDSALVVVQYTRARSLHVFQSAVSRAESSGVQWAEVTPIHVRYIYTEFTLYRVILPSVASAGWCGGAQPAGLHHPGLHSLGVSLNATAPTQSSLQSQPST